MERFEKTECDSRFTMKFLPLLAIFILSCADQTTGPVESGHPGLQSHYTSIRTISSDDPASSIRQDTVRATIEGYLDSYLGYMNVAQISTCGGISYMILGQDGRLITREQIIFPGILSAPSHWQEWPFVGEPVEVVLLDTVVGDERLRASWTARPTGRRRVVLLGREFEGYDLSYTFISEIESEEFTRVVDGTATYVPEIGWRSRIDDTMRLISAGDTVSTVRTTERLVDFVIRPIP